MLPDLPDEVQELALGPPADLIAFGRWDETDWRAYPNGEDAIKHLLWGGTVLSSHRLGRAIDVNYYQAVVVPRSVAGIQDTRFQEWQAWDILRNWVRQTAHGGAFLPAWTLLRKVEQAVHAEIERWDMFRPDDWHDRVSAAIRHGEDEYEGEVERLRAFGGDPESPMNGPAGWHVPVVPWPGLERR